MTVGVDVHVTLAELLKEISLVHSLLVLLPSVVPPRKYFLHLFLVAVVQHLSTVVSSASILPVVALEHLSATLSSASILHLSPVVSLEHLLSAVSLPSVVRLSVLVALGYFPTAVSTPLIVL